MSKISEEEIQRRLELLSQVQPSAQSAGRAVERVRSVLAEHKQVPKTKNINIWRIIMRSRVIKLAAAAVIIISFFGVINLFVGTGSSVALAEVLQKIEQVQAFIYKMKMNATGNEQPGMLTGLKQMDATITISTEYGMKMDMNMISFKETGQNMRQLMYTLTKEGKVYMIMPEQKKYIQMEFDESTFERMKKQSNDPRELLKQILNSKYTNIGKSVIDGIEVEGFMTTDPAVASGMMEDVQVTLWVDRETELPVREEIYYKINEQTEMEGELYDFQWDAQVNADEFKPVIPEDYTTMLPGGYKLPSASEEGAIEGLRFCEKLLGRYPKKIDMMNLMSEVMTIKDTNNPTEAALRLREEIEELKADTNNLPDEEKTKKILDIMRPVQSLGMFYMALVQDNKEPVYYGESITPGDANEVLLRWKVSDNEYRVIFGDLGAETVAVDELAELEADLIE
jgi:outer membrane lipoprotein-sorting protein